MGIIKIEHKGEYKNTEEFLEAIVNLSIRQILSSFGDRGVQALSAATPRDSGLTAASWTYDILQEKNMWTITWNNTNVNKGVPIAILIQYGHSTRQGGYVRGIDYINPAMAPIFEEIANEASREVNRL